MKKINKLSLIHLSKTEMEQREMNVLKGGCTCVCAGGANCPCAYEGPKCPVGDDYWGGATTAENLAANNPDTSHDEHDGTNV